MTSIKPTGGPGGVQPPGAEGTGATGGAEHKTGPSFQDRVGESRESANADPARVGSAGGTPAASAQSVVADLRAGRITPDEAVQRLTDQAVRRSGAPTSMRAAVESRVREMLASDPLVRDLLRQMGATLPPEK